MTKPVFPIALLLEGRACLVVGSGPEALSRTRALLDAHARVVVVSNPASEDIRALAQSGQVELHEREFSDGDLEGKWLAVLVDEDAALAARMAHLAEDARVFFCAVDQPEHNSYAHMAQARAGLLTVAISTAGQAPALGRRLREELERLLTTSRMAEFVDELASLRARTPSAARRVVLGAAVAGVHFTGELALESERPAQF
jgi:precorrin-2 dehydrogenase/sirohydrochlorin ferrochelatase